MNVADITGVIKFKKDASPESKQKTLDQIKKDGGKILKDDNVNNPSEYKGLLPLPPSVTLSASRFSAV